MILFDTNALIYAFDAGAPFHQWARVTLQEALHTEGAAVNPVILAELCVGDADAGTVSMRLEQMGIIQLNLPMETAMVCAAAFTLYLRNRRISGEPVSPKVPLPDFFIGAHANLLGLPLATADCSRYRTYFPDVRLVTPPGMED